LDLETEKSGFPQQLLHLGEHMKKRMVKAVLASALIVPGVSAFAGAGANVQVCLNLQNQPVMPYTATVTPGNSSNSQCMNKYGNKALITVSSVGLNCASVGYIEAKASSSNGDTCGTSSSYWPVAYSTPSGAGGGASGSAQLNIVTGIFSSNSASLSNQQASTQMCAAGALCSSTSVSWPHGHVVQLFVIFTPGGN
jgi:hypothetical protein